MEYSFEPIDINVNITLYKFNIIFKFIQKYGIHTYNYLLIQAKRDKLNIKNLNPPGVYKKRRGKRNLGEKFDSKFYPSNYKKDVIYMNYEDLLDNLYMEKKGIDYQLRPSNNDYLINKKNENYNNIIDNNLKSNNINNNLNLNYSNAKNGNKNDNNNNSNNYINYNNMNNENLKNNTNGEKEEEEIIINNNKKNQITYNQNYNNNYNINDNNNKNILRGRKPNKIKSDLDNKDKNILNRYEDNNNIHEEEIENQNNNIENDIDNDKEYNDYQNPSSNNENNNINDIEDYRLNFVLQKLGLESLINVFESYHMSFNDVLFLSKDDLNELGFKIFQKNRLLSFIEEYTSKAQNYTLEEIKAFFEENSIFNLSHNQE